MVGMKKAKSALEGHFHADHADLEKGRHETKHNI